MSADLLTFHMLQRQIFGICPKCGEFFRLSDSHVYLKEKPKLDWMDKFQRKIERLDEKEENLNEMLEELREQGREKGRRLAKSLLRKIDPVFTPRKLDPSDAKILFHPVDYVVFNGMNDSSIKNVIFLDRDARPPELRPIQQSIQMAIENGEYEWQTLRIKDDGDIESE